MLAFSVVLWVAGSSLGLGAITRYSLAPGEAPEPPAAWPAGTSLRTDPYRASLVMAVHPRCPCSRASLAELAKLMAHVGDRVTAHVVFVVPPGVGEEWTQTDLWMQAAAIPGVAAVEDRGDAARFRLATSGHTLLYGRDGELLFSGGITSARGHAGDNVGSDAIASRLLRDEEAAQRTVVFGCALYGANEGDERRGRHGPNDAETDRSTELEAAGPSAAARAVDRRGDA